MFYERKNAIGQHGRRIRPYLDVPIKTVGIYNAVKLRFDPLESVVDINFHIFNFFSYEFLMKVNRIVIFLIESIFLFTD